MFGDVTGGGRAGRLRLYAGVHGISAQGDFPYLNDNGTAFNTADDVTMPRRNNDLQQVDGVLRAGLTLAGRRSLNLGADRVRARRRAAGPRNRLPTTRARFQTMRGLGYLRYESRDDLGTGGRLQAQLFASTQRDRLDDAANETGLGGAAVTRNTTADHGPERPRGAAVRRVGPRRDRARGAVRELPARERGRGGSGRRAGAAGRGRRGRGDRSALAVGEPRRHPVRAARGDAGRDQPARCHGDADRRDAGRVPQSPVLRGSALVRPLVDRPALKITAKANVGRYARVPSFIELYGNGTAMVLGNADFVPEHGTNSDVGVWIDRPGERLGVLSRTTAFASWVDDLIQWQYASWGQARADNMARARIVGVEQELRLLFGRWGRLVGQGTVLDARDRSGSLAANGNQLPYHARYRGYLRPELVRIDLPAGLALGAYADAEMRMRYFTDAANLLDQGCSSARRLRRHRRPGRAARLRVTASAANLTDTRLQDVDTWSLPGRTVFLALAYAPFGAGDGGGSAIFNPRYGQ